MNRGDSGNYSNQECELTDDRKLCICADPGNCQVVPDGWRCKREVLCGCGAHADVITKRGEPLCHTCHDGLQQMEARMLLDVQSSCGNTRHADHGRSGVPE